MQKLIDELTAMEKAATRGPWSMRISYTGGYKIEELEIHDFIDGDATLIVSMRNALPKLLSTCAEHIRLIDRMETIRQESNAAVARADKAEAERDYLAEAAAARGCPAHGFRNCDKFINDGGKCPEAVEAAYRKECWIETARVAQEAREEEQDAMREGVKNGQ